MKRPLLLAFILCSLTVHATHLRSGIIRAERMSCTNRTFRITITVFTDTQSPVLFGGEQDILDFGDGTRMLVPETPNNPFPGAPNVGIASFTAIHTYAASGAYTISYLEPNRNEGVLNMDNSVLTTFYTETKIDISNPGCSNSPIVLIPPVNQACTGVAFSYNPGAYDPDGDSLSYQLVKPFRDRNLSVDNYKSPADPEFYTNYNSANEAGNGPPTFSIDPADGMLTWDAPGMVGEYVAAIAIFEWRKLNGQWFRIGHVRIDMQILVVDCNNNQRPLLTIPEDMCVVAGTTISQTIIGTDPDNHDVSIEAFSEIFAPTSSQSPATAEPNGTIQSSNPSAELEFNWNTIAEHVKEKPYQIVFKITNYALGVQLTSYQVWQLRVLPPPPVLESVNIDLPEQHASLTWDAYDIEDDATIQVWRKVDDTNFVPSDCEVGTPAALGFSLVASVAAKNELGQPVTSYTDTNGGSGLSDGAKYCYRLVAVFPSPSGGKSFMSNEVCIDPIPVEAPMITHVTVDKTGTTNGEVTIRWIEPLDIDGGQFPGPYQYIVQRSSGAGFTSVTSKISGLVFTDVGLNTSNQHYSYRIVLFSSASVNPIDTSSVASSTRLTLNAQLNSIELNWSAQVPWSNQIEDYPLHEIYRGEEGAIESEMVLIDEINVSEGLTYTDTGKLAPGDTLNDEKTYCYRIMARGGYGNPSITSPMNNFSQINCIQPLIVGIGDELIPVVEIYPNPVQNFLKIEFQDIRPVEIILYDQQGKIQIRQRATETTLIDVQNLSNGLYLCEVRKANRSLKKMRIIKR